MSMRYLWVRDKQTGEPVPIPTSSIPKEIRPDNWFENWYWRYRPDKEDLEPLIRALYDDYPLNEEGIKKLAQYLVDYACHVAVASYIFFGELDYNVPCIKKLRELRDGATSKDDIREMIRVGMDYALDPL